MALIKIARVKFATDQSMTTITNTPGTAFRDAVSDLIQDVAAGVIADDPTIIQAAEQAVEDAIDTIFVPMLDGLVEQPQVSASRLYTVPFVDEERRVFGGIYLDGTVEFARQSGALPSTPSGVQGSTPLASANGRVFGRVYDDGSVHFAKLLNEGGTPGTGGSMYVEGQTVSERHAIVAVGDSLTDSSGGTWPNEDTWPGHLGVANPDAVVTNLGEGGFTVDEVAIKVGALPLILQSAVTVPASGTVQLAVQSGIGWRTQGRTVSIPGTLGGIAGTLTRIPDDPVTLTFESDGSVSGDVPTGALFTSAHDPHKWDIMILGAGRNDISLGVTGTHATVVEHVTSGLQRIIDWMAPQRKRLLLWGTLNASTELVGSENYNQVMAVNSWCADTYPDVWIDIRSWLVHDAIYELGITPTQADLDAMAGDAPPPSVTDGGVHFTKAAAARIAPIFDLAIRRRDWKA